VASKSAWSAHWQVFALGLAAQGFIVGAATQVTRRPLTALLLSVVILLIGAATTASSLRIDLFAGVDRGMLDEYEKVLLVGDFEDLRLMNSASYRDRESRIPAESRPYSSWRPYQRIIVHGVVKRSMGPSYMWIVLQLTISVAGAAIPILGLFEL
jgi:hypothetical protein